MELKIEDVKVGDELECIDPDSFMQDARKTARYGLCNDHIVASRGFVVKNTNYDCVYIQHRSELYIQKEYLKYFRKNPKLQFSDLEVGDYVYVRDDLKGGREYGCNTWFSDMKKSQLIEINRFKENKIVHDGRIYTHEMLDLSRSMKKEDYLKMNETKKNESFYELQEVAFQAYKDGLINSVAFENKLAPSLIRINGNVIFDQHVSYKYDIDRIKSLYKETFVIERKDDIKRVKSGANIVLTNSVSLTAHNVFCDYIIVTKEAHASYDIDVLKGATVTQSK